MAFAASSASAIASIFRCLESIHSRELEQRPHTVQERQERRKSKERKDGIVFLDRACEAGKPQQGGSGAQRDHLQCVRLHCFSLTLLPNCCLFVERQESDAYRLPRAAYRWPACISIAIRLRYLPCRRGSLSCKSFLMLLPKLPFGQQRAFDAGRECAPRFIFRRKPFVDLESLHAVLRKFETLSGRM